MVLKQDIKFKFYRALVVDNQDPENFGRVKLWIPDLMHDIEPKDGLWARPANCPYGAGHKDLQDGVRHAGSSYIPSKNHWVWCFFEDDNFNVPYYTSSLYLENQPITPENTKGDQPWNKWVILRSPKGRVIFISDDPSDSRIMLTGTKRAYDTEDPGSSTHSILDNQIVIMIDERDGQSPKVTVSDHRGNFLQLVVDQDKWLMYSSHSGVLNFYTDSNLITIDESGKKIQLNNNGGTINIDGGGTINVDASSTVYINGGGSVIINAPQIHLNCGDGSTASKQPIPSERIEE